MKKTLLIGLCTFALANQGLAQEKLTVDNSGTSYYPLAKRFGLNIPASTPFTDLQKQADALKALDLRYVRIPTSWGNAGSSLYDSEDVTAAGAIDFTRTDEIVSIATANGASPIFVVSVPQALGGNVPSDIATWGKINYDFSKHWINKGISSPTYEIIEGYGNPAVCALSHEEYAKTFSAAQQAIEFTDESRRHITPRVLPGSFIGDANAAMMFLRHDGDRWNTDPDNTDDPDPTVNKYPMAFNALAAHVDGRDQLLHRLLEGGDLYEISNGWTPFRWENYFTEFNVAAPKTDSKSVGNEGVIAMLDFANDFANASGVTRVYVSQIIDGTDGTKGVISSDGSKTPLYHAIMLWNKMPLNSRPVAGLTELKALASSDCNASAVVVWNNGASDKSAELTLQNIPFAKGSLKAYGIDGSVRDLGNIAGTTANATVSVPAGSAVFVFAENDEPTEYVPVGSVASNHHMWWFRYTEGWAWQYFDPISTNIFLGDATDDILHSNKPDEGNFGVNHMGIDLVNVPDKIHVEVEKFGDVKRMDENSAIYLRVDYETLFEEDDYREFAYDKPTVYYDTKNALIDFAAGSTPDIYPGGAVSLASMKDAGNAHEVDYLTPGGFDIDLASNAPEGWTGNIRVIAYLQNPGAHDAGGVSYNFRLFAAKKSSSAVEGIIADSNDIRINYSGDMVTVDSASKVNSISVVDMSGHKIAYTAGNSLSTTGIEKGIYVVVVKTVNGSVSQKIAI